MTDLRLAVIGFGARARLAGLAHRPGAGAVVVACVDPRPAALEAARARFGAQIALYPDHRGLTRAEVDAALILAPDHLHERIAIDLLSAGIATFVEKPLAITIEGADAILAEAARSGTALYVGHNMRHAPFVLAMREVIGRGLIGTVASIWCRHFVGHGGDYYFKDWHADRRYTNSLLLQKGVHDIDIIHWLAGGRSVLASAMGTLRVYGEITDRQDRSDQLMPQWLDPTNNWPPPRQRGLNPVVDVEDLSIVNLQLDNGVLATYQQCHFTPDYWRNYTVIGTAGRLENFGDFGSSQIKVWHAGRGDYRAEADLVIDVPANEGAHGGADELLLDEFLRYVQVGGATRTSPIAARDAVAAGCAATQSLRGGSVPVPIPPVGAQIQAHFADPVGVSTLSLPEQSGWGSAGTDSGR